MPRYRGLSPGVLHGLLVLLKYVRSLPRQPPQQVGGAILHYLAKVGVTNFATRVLVAVVAAALDAKLWISLSLGIPAQKSPRDAHTLGTILAL